MGLCDLLARANDVGRTCDNIEDIRDLLQELLDLLCNQGLCSTTPQEVAIVEDCVDESYDFDALFGDCIKDNRVVFSVCDEGNSIWYGVNIDEDTVWLPFLLRGTGHNTTVYNRTTGETGASFINIQTYTIPTIPGLIYDVTVGYGYRILTFGAGSGPVDAVNFRFRSAQAAHLLSPGLIIEGYRNGYLGQFNYKFVANSTSETITVEGRANGTFSGWQFQFFTNYLNWSVS